MTKRQECQKCQKYQKCKKKFKNAKKDTTSWGWVGPSSRLVQLELLKKFEIKFKVVDEVLVIVIVYQLCIVYLVHHVVHLVHKI